MLSRRSFIRKNVLGSLFYPLIGSIIPLGQFIQQRKSPLFTDGATAKVEDFLLDSKRIYFNTSSLGPSLKTVVEATCENWSHLEINGYDGKQLAKKAHQKVGKFFNVPAEDIAMTHNTTEGINIAARSIPLKQGDEVILSTHEHVGGAAPWLVLAKEMGIKVKFWELDTSGKNLLDELENLISDNTKVLAVSHVLCTTGMQLPIEGIVQLCRRKGVYSVIDGAQAVGMVSVDLGGIQPDFYACAAHKWLFGPKGIGMLYINPKIMGELKPVFVGAYSDKAYNLKKKQFDLREVAERNTYGTRNVSLMVGVEKAMEWNTTTGWDRITSNAEKQKARFKKLIQSEDFEFMESEVEFRTSILTLRSNQINNQSIVNRLNNEFKIRVRYIYENDLDAVRISFAFFNTDQQVELLAAAFNELTK